jgi:hypothetical protein
LAASAAGYAKIVKGVRVFAGSALTDHPSALQEGMSVPRIIAAAGALAVTALVTAVDWLFTRGTEDGMPVWAPKREEAHHG